MGIAEPALRLLHYAVLLGLFGWTAFRVVGLRKQCWLPDARASAGLVSAAAVAPLISAALMLSSIAAMMGVAITALDWSMTEAMVLGTSMGGAFLARMAFLIIALGALIVAQRINAAMPIAAVCFAGALISLGWSGHAAATEGAPGLLHRINNGIHLIAAGYWLGAIGWFLLLTVKAPFRPEADIAQPLLGVMHRFAPMGIALVATVSVTGLINAHLIFGIENGVTVLTTTYGALLATKIALVGGMIAFGAHHAQVGRRHAKTDAKRPHDRGRTLAALRITLAGEFALALCVTALVAFLGRLSPMVEP